MAERRTEYKWIKRIIESEMYIRDEIELLSHKRPSHLIRRRVAW